VRLGERDDLDVAMAREGLRPGPDQPLALVALLGMGSAPMLWGQTLDSPLLDADSLERASVGDAVDGLRLVAAARCWCCPRAAWPGRAMRPCWCWRATPAMPWRRWPSARARRWPCSICTGVCCAPPMLRCGRQRPRTWRCAVRNTPNWS